MPVPISTQRRMVVYRWLLQHARWVVRESHEGFVSLLCVIAGVPLVFGEVDAQSMDALVPTPVVVLWGTVLVIGGLATLIGLVRGYSTKVAFTRALAYRRLEYYGLTLLWWVGVIYTIAVALAAGQRGFPGVMIILAFALTCGVRAFIVHTEIEIDIHGIELVGTNGSTSEA